jgi:protein-disulfide isomerase
MQKPKTKRKGAGQNNLIIAVIVGAIAVAVGFIIINNLGLGAPAVDVNYEAIPVTRSEDGAFVAGDPQAPLTLVAWEDFRCGYCLSYEPTLEQFLKDYVETGKMKFEFRMLQTASPDDTIFRLAQCAGEQNPDKFYEYRHELFRMTSRGWSAANSPREFARNMNLNYDNLLDCAGGVTQIATDAALAQRVGVTGTPALALRRADGTLTLVPGQAPSYSALKTYLDAQLGS